MSSVVLDDSVLVERAPGILWRLTGDRVMTHRIDAPPETAANDLMGPVAMVWLVLDEPGTQRELHARLVEAQVTVADLDAHLDQLVAAGLVVEHPAPRGEGGR